MFEYVLGNSSDGMLSHTRENGIAKFIEASSTSTCCTVSQDQRQGQGTYLRAALNNVESVDSMFEQEGDRNVQQLGTD